MCCQSSTRRASSRQSYSRSRGRGGIRRSSLGAFRSSESFHFTPHKNFPGNGNGNMPELFVTIPNNTVELEQNMEARYGQHSVTEKLPSAEGDQRRPTKPLPSSGLKKEMAPAVARLFSSVPTAMMPIGDEVVELLDVHPQGIELNNFCHAFETCFRRPFDSHWSDVGNLRQMFNSMVDLVECIEHGSEVIVRGKFGGTEYFQGNALQL